MVKNDEIDDISLIGGSLCFHFVNTVHDYKANEIADYMFNGLDLIAWAKKVEIINSEEANRLEVVLLEDQKAGEKFFLKGIKLRNLLYRMFAAVSREERIMEKELKLFNEYLEEYFKLLKLTFRDGQYAESYDLPADNLMRIIAPVVRDTYDVLLFQKLKRIRECPNCGWLFLDTSKNGKRRWCSMQSCGSNVKALEWYHRHKGD